MLDKKSDVIGHVINASGRWGDHGLKSGCCSDEIGKLEVELFTFCQTNGSYN
tara:strand:+ start:569 stop:724 length:156 start_codon:yes stop_codon:yes gene_type:complete